MAIKEIKREWSPEQLGFVRTFLLHKEKDVKDLPSCCTGSVATVSETDNEYIRTPDGWKLRTECAEGSGVDAKVAKNAENIAKSGFVEKLAPVEHVVFTGADIQNRQSLVKTQDCQLKAGDLDNVKNGDKVVFRVAPSGEYTKGTTAYTAAEQTDDVATCSVGVNGYGLNTWTFKFESYAPLIIKPDGSAMVSLNEVSLIDNGAEYLKCKRTASGSHPNTANAANNLAFDLSIYLSDEQSAYDGLTLWSSTEGSTKRFELSVDDSANATLTDVDTGESKGLGGSGGGGGYEFVISANGDGPSYWAKGNGLDFINRLIDGPAPMVCIHSTNLDHEYPNVYLSFPIRVEIASGSGKWCAIIPGDDASAIYINMETGEIEND